MNNDRLIIDVTKNSHYFSYFRYPAGELQVRLNPDKLSEIAAADTVQLVARLPEALDVMKLSLLLNALAPVAFVTELYLPYLPYSRADRRFVPGDCFGLETYQNVLQSNKNLDWIITFDMHNMFSDSPDDSVQNIPANGIIEKALDDFGAKFPPGNHINVLIPDKGAQGRYIYSSKFPLRIHNCEKLRDPVTGLLSGFHVPPEARDGNPVFIADDICDGGGTFMGLAKEFQRDKKLPAMGLYVSHGIFSQGLGGLLAHFDFIATTNSINQLAYKPSLLKVYEIPPA